MRYRARLLMLALGLVTALLAGCSSSPGADRTAGSPVTAAEAQAIAGLLHRDFQAGGAGFVVTAPYSHDAVLTLTGDIDFRHSIGRAQAVTTYSDGRADETRTLFFTPEDLWVGDVPGLTTALTKAGLPKATYLRRPLTLPYDAAGMPLLDVLTRVLVDLSSPTSDDPRFFQDGHTTWQGQRSIDSRLASLFRLRDGRTVAVAASDDLLLQFATPLQSGDFDVTVTLSDHGPRMIDLPSASETAEVADHQAIATALGV
ncbi:MAG: hypothetical protein ACXVX8_10715 [Blastococcus sp.]